MPVGGSKLARLYARLKCKGCKRWMKHGPLTSRTVLQRADPPNDRYCVECEKGKGAR